MTGNISSDSNWDEEDAGWVEETPEEEIDRLIENVEISANASSCSELRNALQRFPLLDATRRAQADFILGECNRKGYKG